MIPSPKVPADDEFVLDDEFALEPESDTPEAFELTPPPEKTPEPQALALPVMEVLPPDFPLPVLARFVPDVRLKADLDAATGYALDVVVQGAEGLQQADLALTTVRASLKAITEHFKEPADIANQLHKRITVLRGEWCAEADAAVKTVGRRIYVEQQRLEALAAEERRKAQAEADRKAREEARKAADEAAKTQAPEKVVEEMKRQAETVTAPPVPPPASAPAPLRGSSTVTTWKARLAGSLADVDPNPEIGTLTISQRARVFELLKAIIDGTAPIAAIEINWSYLNSRAKADKSTLAIPGIEPFADGGVRAKGSRGK